MNVLYFIVVLILVTVIFGLIVGLCVNKYLEDFYNKGRKRNKKSKK